MQQTFLYLSLFSIVFIGCEIGGLKTGLYDTNALMAFLSLVFLLFVLVNKVVADENFRKPTRPEVFFCLYLIWSTISFYFSVNPDITSFHAIKSLAALTFGVGLLGYLKNEDQVKRLWLVSVLFAGVHAGLGLLQQFFPSYLYKPEIFNSSSTSLFNNPNFYSCYLLIHIPVGFYLMVTTNLKPLKFLLGGIWVMLWIALGFSGSPGGQLVAVLEIITLLIFLFLNKEFSRQKILGGLIVLSLITYILLAMTLGPVSNSNPDIPTNLLARRPWIWEHMENRFMYWKGAWVLFLDNWLFGSGLGTFSERYSQIGFKLSPPHAHNLFFQTAADTGILGLGLLTTCIIFLFQKLIAVYKNKGNLTVDLRASIGISVLGFITHNLIEYNWFTSNFIFLFVIQVVSLQFLNVDRENLIEHSNSSSFFEKYIPIGLLGLLIIITGTSVLNYYRYNQIINKSLLESGSLKEVEEKLNQAKTLCSHCGSPYYLSGFAYFDQAKKLKSSKLLDKAQNEFGEALKRTPFSSNLHMIRGDLFSLQGKNIEAKASYQMAMRDTRYKAMAEIKIKGLKTEN